MVFVPKAHMNSDAFTKNYQLFHFNAIHAPNGM